MVGGMKIVGHSRDGTGFVFVLETTPGRGRTLTVRRGVATLYPEMYLDTIIRAPFVPYDGDQAAIIALAKRVEREGETRVGGSAKIPVYRLAGVVAPAAA